MAVDTEYMMLVVLIGGVLFMSLSNRKTKDVPDVSNMVQDVDMEEVTLRATKYIETDFVKKEEAKKQLFRDGQNNAQIQMIAKYLIDETRKMINMQNYFDNALNSPKGVGTTQWMKANYPDEFLNWQAARTYCFNRANEFKLLWYQLGDLGERQWMTINQWIVNVPNEVLNRLDSYNQGNYEQVMNWNFNQINQQLIQLYRRDAGIKEAPSTESFKKMDENQKDRLRNQDVMMEVDDQNAGRWLIPSSNDPDRIHLQRVSQVGRNVGGVQMVQRTIHEFQGHRDDIQQVISGSDPYGDQGYNAPTSSQGYAYDTIPPSARSMGGEADDLFQVSKQSLLQDRRDDNLGERNSYMNPSMHSQSISQYNSQVGDFDTNDQDAVRSPMRGGRSASDFRTTEASQIKGTLPTNPYQKEQFAQLPRESGALDSEIRDLRDEAEKATYSQAVLEIAGESDRVPNNLVPSYNTVNNIPSKPTLPNYINETWATDQRPKTKEIIIPPTGTKQAKAPPEGNDDTQLWSTSTRPSTWNATEMIAAINVTSPRGRESFDKRKRFDELDKDRLDEFDPQSNKAVKVAAGSGGKVGISTTYGAEP